MIVLLAGMGALAAEQVVVETLLFDVTDDRLVERVIAASGSTTAFDALWVTVRDDARIEAISAPSLITLPDEPAEVKVGIPAGTFEVHVRVKPASGVHHLRTHAALDEQRWSFDGFLGEGALLVIGADHQMLLQRVHVVDDGVALLRQKKKEAHTLAEQELAGLGPAARRRWLDRALDEAAL